MPSVDDLIAQNKGLVYKQLWKFKLNEDPQAESIAFEALLTAVTTYNGTTKLSTYATVLIYNALGSYVRSLNAKRQIQTVSYHSVAFSDENGDHEYIELLTSNESTEEACLRRELRRLTREAFQEAYDNLTNDKHKEILLAWSDSGFEAQTTEIAKMIGVSQSYVSQVINNFKATLKKKLEDVYYD